MIKVSLALAVLPLAAFGFQARGGEPVLRLKEERMTLEYSATAGEAAIIVRAESEEELDRVQVRGPGGESLLELRAVSGDLALSEFLIQTEEFDSPSIFDTYQEGPYEMRGWTVEGQPVMGMAELSHELLAAPIVITPDDGEDVDADEVTVIWVGDPNAAGYQIVVEQGDDDQLVAKLPRDATSFQVPAGILEAGKLSHVEVGVVGRNGNTTLVDVEFFTR